MPRRNTTAEGYGHPHRQHRERWAPMVAAGGVDCARCGEPIDPAEPWDLGHTDDRRTYSGPEHAGCNRGAAARKANRRRANPHSRDWWA